MLPSGGAAAAMQPGRARIVAGKGFFTMKPVEIIV